MTKNMYLNIYPLGTKEPHNTQTTESRWFLSLENVLQKRYKNIYIHSEYCKTFRENTH